VTDQHTKSVVVTGASTGIGAAAVAELVGRGLHVWAGVRSDADAERLSSLYGDKVSVLRLDVTDPVAVAAAGERVAAAGPLAGLVNNAGVALPGPLEYLPIAALREQFEVNLIGQLAVTQAMLPALRAATDPPGRVVMVGSIAGRVAGPLLGAYHASKFALVGLTDSLRAELAPWRIAVVLLEPGAIATRIWQRGGDRSVEILDGMPADGQQRYAAQIGRIRKATERAERRGIPAAVPAAAIAHALTDPRPRPRYLIGRDAMAGSMLARLPHRLRYRLTAARE
jgi:NAD(P)-dependent dehydrogenase (short-subunit alcohol dehydrogenase family)